MLGCPTCQRAPFAPEEEALGCRTRPARFCDIDHVTPYAEGGPTSPGNLQLLCRRHHRLKTHGAWAVTMTADATCVWESPLGHWYATYPGNPTAEPLTPDQGLARVA